MAIKLIQFKNKTSACISTGNDDYKEIYFDIDTKTMKILNHESSSIILNHISNAIGCSEHDKISALLTCIINVENYSLRLISYGLSPCSDCNFYWNETCDSNFTNLCSGKNIHLKSLLSNSRTLPKIEGLNKEADGLLKDIWTMLMEFVIYWEITFFIYMPICAATIVLCFFSLQQLLKFFFQKSRQRKRVRKMAKARLLELQLQKEMEEEMERQRLEEIKHQEMMSLKSKNKNTLKKNNNKKAPAPSLNNDNSKGTLNKLEKQMSNNSNDVKNNSEITSIVTSNDDNTKELENQILNNKNDIEIVAVDSDELDNLISELNNELLDPEFLPPPPPPID